MESTIPIDVQEFVVKHIHSLDQLEVLLLVAALPDREWSIDAVYNVVLSTRSLVAERLDSLVSMGVLVRAGEPPVYRYQPSNENLARVISALGAAYKLSRHRIVELIYCRSKSDGSLKHFIEAFQFKRKE